MSAMSPEVKSMTCVDDIVSAVRAAVSDGATLTAGRRQDADRRIDLSTMNQVVDYPARDMTITVQAGMSVRDLQKVLLEENQQLPVDCPDPAMSVGAFVACNYSGSRQYGYGTLRDYLIGMQAVDGQGRIFHAGGRVVKNVAGYDLCRLIIGSWGRLAILTQLTFKLKPRPEQSAISRFSWKSAKQAAAALSLLNTSVARPTLLDLKTAPKEPWVIDVGVDGTESSCAWELARVRSELSSCDKMHVLIQGHDDCTEYCTETSREHLPESRRLLIRILPSRVVEAGQSVTAHGSHLMAHAGNGIILASLPESSSAKKLTGAATRFVADCGGAVYRPGEMPVGASLQEQRLVQTFDPHQVFGTSRTVMEL